MYECCILLAGWGQGIQLGIYAAIIVGGGTAHYPIPMNKATGVSGLRLKLQLHDAIYRLRFYSKSLIHILLLTNLHNNVASIQ